MHIDTHKKTLKTTTTVTAEATSILFCEGPSRRFVVNVRRCSPTFHHSITFRLRFDPVLLEPMLGCAEPPVSGLHHHYRDSALGCVCVCVRVFFSFLSLFQLIDFSNRNYCFTVYCAPRLLTLWENRPSSVMNVLCVVYLTG